MYWEFIGDIRLIFEWWGMKIEHLHTEYADVAYAWDLMNSKLLILSVTSRRDPLAKTSRTVIKSVFDPH